MSDPLTYEQAREFVVSVWGYYDSEFVIGHDEHEESRAELDAVLRYFDSLRVAAINYLMWEPNEFYQDWPAQMKADRMALARALGND